MSTNTVNSQNSITAPLRIGSYNDMRKTEINIKLENRYRAAAAANRRALGIPQDQVVRRTNDPVPNCNYNRIRIFVTRKYSEPSSRHFIRCAQMRQIVITNEIAVTVHGNLGRCSFGVNGPRFARVDFRDPVLGLPDGKLRLPFSDSVENVLHAKDMMNDQLRGIFARNNIHIPFGTRLRFAVDPYDFMVRVTGTEDMALIEQIEKWLNYGQNGMQLFQYIFDSGSAHDSIQMSFDQKHRYMLMWRVLNVTGINISELNIVNGAFLTKDGRNIADVFAEALGPKAGGEAGFIRRELNRLAPIWDSIPPLILQIGWHNNALVNLHGNRLDFRA